MVAGSVSVGFSNNPENASFDGIFNGTSKKLIDLQNLLRNSIKNQVSRLRFTNEHRIIDWHIQDAVLQFYASFVTQDNRAADMVIRC